MKNVVSFLLVVFFLFAEQYAQAEKVEVIASTKMANGLMFLLSTRGTCEEGFSGIVASANNRPLKFCWSISEDYENIFVLYDDGDFRVYPTSNFNFPKATKDPSERLL